MDCGLAFYVRFRFEFHHDQKFVRLFAVVRPILKLGRTTLGMRHLRKLVKPACWKSRTENDQLNVHIYYCILEALGCITLTNVCWKGRIAIVGYHN